MGAFDGYLDDPMNWLYVRSNSDGYYVNNFALHPDPNDQTQLAKLSKLSSLFHNKNVFYETDVTRTTDEEDKIKIDVLRLFFNITFATMNAGWTASRIQALQWRSWRPVLAMQGPWVIDGNITSPAGASERDAIDHMSGSSTDGPLGLWADNRNNMRSGSYSMVHYSHQHKKIAMVMMAPYLSGTGDLYLTIGQSCVRGHEDNDATPEIWVLSYYAAQLQQYPVTPEQEDGAPAGTITGLAYWLIHHLHGGNVKLETQPGNDLTLSGNDALVTVPVFTTSTVTMKLLHQDKKWLDLCPVIRIQSINTSSDWNVRFYVNNKDVTQAASSERGFPFVRELRMWAGDSHDLQITFVSEHENPQPMDLLLEVMSHPSEMKRVQYVNMHISHLKM